MNRVLVAMSRDKLADEYDVTYNEYIRLKAWVRNNPAQIDGVLEATRKIRQLKSALSDMREDLGDYDG